jgi:Bacterial dnaA  protein
MRKGDRVAEERVPNLIPRFGLEATIAILRKSAEQKKVKLPKDVALYVAQNLRSNAQALEGALMRVIAYSSLTGTEITLATTQRVLKDFIDEQGHDVAIDSLPSLIPQRFGTKEAKIRFQDSTAADSQVVFSLLKAGDGRKTRRVLEVNMREGERERLARWDRYERELECHAKKRKQA